MQLMGVYNSAFCNVNAQYWTQNPDDVRITVSSNAAINIQTANKYWIPTGITATLFLGVVSFCGWWYQRRLRGLFRELVSDIGNPESEREDIKASCPEVKEVQIGEMGDGNYHNDVEDGKLGFDAFSEATLQHSSQEQV